MPRINRHGELVCKRWVISASVAVGRDHYHQHTGERIFPQADESIPGRCLSKPEGPDWKKPIDAYMTAPGKGTGMCIEISLVSRLPDSFLSDLTCPYLLGCLNL